MSLTSAQEERLFTNIGALTMASETTQKTLADVQEGQQAMLVSQAELRTEIQSRPCEAHARLIESLGKTLEGLPACPVAEPPKGWGDYWRWMALLGAVVSAATGAWIKYG